MQASSTVKSLSSTHTSSHSLHSLVLSLSPSPLVAASFVAASFVAAPPTPSFCLTGTPERVPHPRGVYGAADTQAGHAAGRTVQGLQFPLSVSRIHAHAHTCTHMHTHARTPIISLCCCCIQLTRIVFILYAICWTVLSTHHLLRLPAWPPAVA